MHECSELQKEGNISNRARYKLGDVYAEKYWLWSLPCTVPDGLRILSRVQIHRVSRPLYVVGSPRTLLWVYPTIEWRAKYSVMLSRQNVLLMIAAVFVAMSMAAVVLQFVSPQTYG